MNRSKLSADHLYPLVKGCFGDVPEHRKNISNIKISISDALMSALAVFSLKQPSLLATEKILRAGTVEGNNMRTLFGIEQPASDTQMRDIIDPINPGLLRKAYRKIFVEIQRSKVLKGYAYRIGDEWYYLISLDGTGHYSSGKEGCGDCMVKNHSSGKKTYHHQLLGASIIHPYKKTVIPLFPEPVSNRDGGGKQDCELKAAERWVKKFRKEHPKLRVVLLLDGLYPNADFIGLLEKMDIRYIMGAKPKKLKAMFSQYGVNSDADLTGKREVVEGIGEKIRKKVTHRFEFINGLDLNMANPGIKVNFLNHSETVEYEEPEQDKKGVGTVVKKFSWVTDIPLSEDLVYRMMRVGRGRWKIENETFRTLKMETGYNLDHNYGHGKKHLCTNLGVLTMLAFLIDQAQEMGCELFREALEKVGVKRTLWETFKGDFRCVVLDCWKMLHGLVTGACRFEGKVVWGADTS